MLGALKFRVKLTRVFPLSSSCYQLLAIQVKHEAKNLPASLWPAANHPRSGCCVVLQAPSAGCEGPAAAGHSDFSNWWCISSLMRSFFLAGREGGSTHYVSSGVTMVSGNALCLDGEQITKGLACMYWCWVLISHASEALADAICS